MRDVMINVGILCYSLTPSTIDLIERIVKDNLDCIRVVVRPLVTTEIYSKPSFEYVEPDKKTKFLSLGRNREENQIVKFNFRKMCDIAKKSDVVISFGVQSMPCLILSYLCRLYKKPFHLVHQTMSLYGERNKKNKLVYFLKSLAIRNAVTHIAQTPSSRDVLEEVYGINRGRVFDAFWDGGLGSLKSISNNKMEDIVVTNDCTLQVIFVGSLIPLKNVEVILRAISNLPKEYKVELSIIGHDHQYPGEEERLKTLSKELGIVDKVFFLGRLNLEDISEKYINSDVIVLPSIKEAWAKVLVEAAYFNTALITTKVNGQAGHLVQERVTGYILEKHNDSNTLCEQLIELYENRDLLNAMKYEAKRYVESFSSSELEVSGYKHIFQNEIYK